jgi:hypothetical protein
MARTLRNLLKNQKGQALAEYQILLPGAILLATLAGRMLSGPINDAYCSVISPFDPSACGGSEVIEAPVVPPENDPEACVTVQESQGGSQCDASADCSVLPGLNSGTWNSTNGDVKVFVIKAGQNYNIYETGSTGDGCYWVQFGESSISWNKIGGGKNCKDISHLQSWFIPQCIPNP